MSMSEHVQGLTQDPGLFPIELSADGRRVRLLRLDERAYAEASFLDGRLIGPGLEGGWTDWAAIGQAADGLPVRAHFIFHVGHVGSTLLSRLMGEHPGLFSLREPALLRDVATGRLGGGGSAGRLSPLLALFSRTWRDEQTALIKATSFVCEIASEMLEATPGSRAILLSATPPAYLRSILGGPASREEAQALAPLRRQRLERRLGAALSADTLGERIALNWLCEAMALAAVAAAFPGRCLWLDFDRILAEPEASLSIALGHLQADPFAIDLASLVRGPIMRRYAKGPEHAYDAALRQQVQADAARRFATEIQRGMAWLQRTAEAYPGVRSALGRAAAAARGSLAAGPATP